MNTRTKIDIPKPDPIRDAIRKTWPGPLKPSEHGGIRYVRGNQTYKIDDLKSVKVRLVDEDGLAETPWAGDGGDHFVLKNHAIAFYPFPNWGLILPKGDGYNISLDGIRTEALNTTILLLHPEAWDDLQADGLLYIDGELNAEACNAQQAKLREEAGCEQSITPADRYN